MKIKYSKSIIIPIITLVTLILVIFTSISIKLLKTEAQYVISYPISKNSTDYSVINGELYQTINNDPSTLRKTYFKEGKLSNDTRYVASININKQDEPMLNIYSIEEKSIISSLKLESFYKYVLSWAQDDSYIIVSDRTSQPYNQNNTLYKFSDKEIIKSKEFTSYGTQILWGKDKFFFPATNDSCLEDICNPRDLILKEFDFSSELESEVLYIEDFEHYPPSVKEFNLNDDGSVDIKLEHNGVEDSTRRIESNDLNLK